MRTELRGMFVSYEADLIADVQCGRLPIKAGIINYDFGELYKWLEMNEGANDTTFSAQQVRALHISMIIDVPQVDLTRVVESHRVIKNHIARDREAIDSFNSFWNDGGPHDHELFLRVLKNCKPWVTGHGGTAAISDDCGAKPYGLQTALGNCYVVTCNVLLNFVPTSSQDFSCESFPIGFCHQGDYLDQLFGQTPDGGQWSPGYALGSFHGTPTSLFRTDPVSSVFKIVFSECAVCAPKAT